MTLWKDASHKEKQQDTHYRELLRIRPRKYRVVRQVLVEMTRKIESYPYWRNR